MFYLMEMGEFKVCFDNDLVPNSSQCIIQFKDDLANDAYKR